MGNILYLNKLNFSRENLELLKKKHKIYLTKNLATFKKKNIINAIFLPMDKYYDNSKLKNSNQKIAQG